jgi:PIN domain
MPSGRPSAATLTTRIVGAFSLDTSVFEAAGFRFDDGPLKHLASQLPPWLQLWMPSVVMSEVERHRTENISRGLQQAQSGLQELHRHAGLGLGFDVRESVLLPLVQERANKLFEDQMQKFLKNHSGQVLKPAYEDFGLELFDRYFSNCPPFGAGKDKKYEFPDAASLLMLERHAVEKGVKAVVVSKDAGWRAFAEGSANIYCVSSIAALTEMFVSHTPEANQIRSHLGHLLANPTSSFLFATKAILESGLRSLPWRLIVPASYRHDVETTVIETTLNQFEFRPNAIGVWVTSSEHDACVAETVIDVDVTLLVSLVIFEVNEIGNRVEIETIRSMINHRFEVKLQMEMTGNLKTSSIETNISKMELGDSTVQVPIDRESLGRKWMNVPVIVNGLEDLEDDIPF